jgi:myo-inositol-1(or 4)-monophosphatase
MLMVRSIESPSLEFQSAIRYSSDAALLHCRQVEHMADIRLETALEAARAAARAGGRTLMAYFGGELEIRKKGRIDLVTEADLAAEEVVLNELRRHFPGCAVLAEESAVAAPDGAWRLAPKDHAGAGNPWSAGPAEPPAVDAADQPVLWVVDPLDGTSNFAHGYPVFCVSVGLLHRGEPVVGVVYDPTREELFEAVRGGGATLNGRPLHTSDCPVLGEAMVVTGFPYDIQTVRDNTVDLFSRFLHGAQAVRRDGSAALDLCYVAAGRFDGFWERRLKPWDTAAAAVIVREAGGLVTRFDGSPFSVFVPEILAAGPRLHPVMVSVLQNR